jgi:hypothetical protein
MNALTFTESRGKGYATATQQERDTAHAMVRRYIAATLSPANADNAAPDEMTLVHGFMRRGALSDSLDHTGGGVWLSYTTHATADGAALLVTAGNDSLEVVRAAYPEDADASADARYDDCGEDNGVVLLSLSVCDNGQPNARDAAAERAITALHAAEKAWHAELVKRIGATLAGPASEVNDDDAAMLGACDEDLRAWCADLRDRVGLNVDAFSAALETYITLRHAELFVSGLHDAIGAENFAEMVARNAAEPRADVCHSHDFCDANMHAADACGESECTDAAIDAMTAAWTAAAPMLGRGVRA